MKMTMHIDEELLARVVEAYGFDSKTEAVEAGLKELDRRMRLKEFREHGLGLTPDELAGGVDPNYDVMAMRGGHPPALAAVAEDKGAPYGSSDTR